MKMNKLLLLIVLTNISLYAELFTEYFKNSVIKSEIQYKEGTRTDVTEGIKDGLEKVYYNTGQLAFKVNNIEGKRDGAMDWYDRKHHHLEVIYYQNGKRHGQNKVFYANGKLRIDVNYINDFKEGKEKFYFDSGKLASVVTYRRGKKEGIQKEYNENGSLNNDVTYKHGYKEGKKRWYNAQGKVIQTEFYKMGRPIHLMKKVQEKKPDATIEALKGLNFNPNNRKIN